LPVYQPPSLRVALGLGDQELEQRVRPALDAADDLVVVAQCLAADQVLQLVQSQQVDAVVVAWTLHRLTPGLLDQLERPGITLLVLVPDPDDTRWRRRNGPVLGVDADAARIREALLSARPGLRPASRPRPAPEPEPVVLKPADGPDQPVGGVIAVTGGVGSPGRTTVAIGLAAALGAATPTVLVEADLCAPSIAAYLDRDPSRNVCTLAHAVREDARLWGPALADELQPLGPHSATAVVLCGPPKREMRGSVAPAMIERLIDELARRYRWVILDVGPELLGIDVAAADHRAALSRAQHVLLVCAADLVGLWHARTALDQLERLVGIERRRVNLILNRHDLRFHHTRQEVEWHLGAPVVSVVPFDHAAAQRAIAEQRPLALDSSSRAARALVSLAERLNEGKLRVPSPPDGRSRSAWWRRVFGRQRPQSADRSGLEPERAQLGVLSQRRSRA
jgi:Mrp family chromosome partitioning ATPase